METHARFFLIGLFSLVVTTALVLFVLWPLGRAASVSPAVLLRSHLSEEGRERSPWP